MKLNKKLMQYGKDLRQLGFDKNVINEELKNQGRYRETLDIGLRYLASSVLGIGVSVYLFSHRENLASFLTAATAMVYHYQMLKATSKAYKLPESAKLIAEEQRIALNTGIEPRISIEKINALSGSLRSSLIQKGILKSI